MADRLTSDEQSPPALQKVAQLLDQPIRNRTHRAYVIERSGLHRGILVHKMTFRKEKCGTVVEHCEQPFHLVG